MAKRILRYQVRQVPVENPITSPAELVSDSEFNELYDWWAMVGSLHNTVLIVILYWATPRPTEVSAT